jgi:hypothetical protein
MPQRLRLEIRDHQHQERQHQEQRLHLGIRDHQVQDHQYQEEVAPQRKAVPQTKALTYGWGMQEALCGRFTVR